MNSKNVNYVILDCDGGSDDAWALLLLLKADAQKHIKLLAVSICGNGNTTLQYASRNMQLILKAYNREEIPIYLGSTEALITSREEIETLGPLFNGTDGFGDIYNESSNLFNNMPDNIQRDHAVSFIYQSLIKYPKSVTLISVGPLTNVALCYMLYNKEFDSNLKALLIMGGNHQGVGNITQSAEFNFYADPEAAHIVLNRLKCPITILPWESCLPNNFDISLKWRFEELGPIIKEMGAVYNILNEVESAIYLTSEMESNWCPSDAMLVAFYLFNDSMTVNKSNRYCTVDLNGLTRGQMVVDHLPNETKNQLNASIIEQCNASFFKKVIRWMLDLEDLPVNVLNNE